MVWDSVSPVAVGENTIPTAAPNRLGNIHSEGVVEALKGEDRKLLVTMVLHHEAIGVPSHPMVETYQFRVHLREVQDFDVAKGLETKARCTPVVNALAIGSFVVGHTITVGPICEHGMVANEARLGLGEV